MIVGALLLIGPMEVISFFSQKERIQATLITVLGIFLVFSGRPKIGLAVEIIGVIYLVRYNHLPPPSTDSQAHLKSLFYLQQYSVDVVSGRQEYGRSRRLILSVWWRRYRRTSCSTAVLVIHSPWFVVYGNRFILVQSKRVASGRYVVKAFIVLISLFIAFTNVL